NGALAGGVGAAVYALHCPELTAPFIAVWYVSGIAVPVLVGALLGPRLLRW
ncbi:NrsF family protein, partial [Variovorax sp. CT11-76]